MLRFAPLTPTLAVKSVREKNPSVPIPSVVIVDDEKSYVELMAQMLLDNLNCTVHPFTRPEAALAALPRIGAGVVVSDYFMPEMDGVEFIRQASKIVPQTAFIIISGHDLDSVSHELVRLKRLKMRLQKPFGWQPLAEAVIEVWPGAGAPRYRE
jgi:two-component system, NtrC family, C4-dicarboxylate transport response regulator DctD